jgi:hypothetical protein
VHPDLSEKGLILVQWETLKQPRPSLPSRLWSFLLVGFCPLCVFSLLSVEDGIKLLTGHRVMSVEANQVVVMDKATKQKQTLPFGICVWSTGLR